MVGVGSVTRIFTVNALHWCRSFIQLHLHLIWLTSEGLRPQWQNLLLSAWHLQCSVWELDSDCVCCVILIAAWIREEWLWANVRGSVLFLAVLLATVHKVCPLSLHDKSDLWQTISSWGVVPGCKMRSISWSLLRRMASSVTVRHENISVPLTIRASGIILGQLVLSVCPLISVWRGLSGSSRVVALCLMVVKDVCLKWAIVSDSISRISWHCTASMLPPASVDNYKHPLMAAAVCMSSV